MEIGQFMHISFSSFGVESPHQQGSRKIMKVMVPEKLTVSNISCVS